MKESEAQVSRDAESRRREMGEAPPGRLLLKMSVPATVGMLANGLYNLVDAIFIGRGVGTHAIGGVTLIFPVQMVLLAFGLSVGQGAASIISRNLGAGDRARVLRTAGNAFALGTLFGSVLLIFGLVFMDFFLDVLGAAAPLRIPAHTYLAIILLGAPFTVLTMVSNNLLRSEGRARASMQVMLTGMGLNIALDPLFIFVFHMGVAGAAWATVIGQLASFVFAAVLFLRGRSLLRFKARHWIPRRDVIKEIVVLGLPTFFRQLGQSVMLIFLNNVLKTYGGALYISAYGVVNRLLLFSLMPLFGMVQGFQPVAGFNYGAGLYGRVRQTLKISVLYATCYISSCFLLLMLFPGFFTGLFSRDPLLIQKAGHVMRFVIAAMPLLGLQIIGSVYFIVVGRGLPGLILGLSRQFLLLLNIVPGLVLSIRTP